MGDLKFIDTMIKDGLWDAFNGYHMGTTAENVARQWQITREEQDKFAVASQNKAGGRQEGRPLQGRDHARHHQDAQGRRGGGARDEYIKAGVTLDIDREAAARRSTRKGTVTAANAQRYQRWRRRCRC